MRALALAGLSLVGLLGAAGLGWLAASALSGEDTRSEEPHVSTAPPPGDIGQRREAVTEGEPEQAAAHDGRDPLIALNNQGIDALEAGDLEAAITLFEECVAADPEQAVYRRNLAESLARAAQRQREENEFADALASLARAVEVAPEREDLAQLLARWTTEAEIEESHWVDRSIHFALSYDGQRRDVLHGYQRVLDLLEEAYADLRDEFGIDPVTLSDPRLKVVLYHPENFDALTGLGDWAGGVFDGVIRVPVQNLDAELGHLREVLRHELSHAFTRSAGGRGVPGWLNEGLAQLFEGPSAEDVARARQRLAIHTGSGGELFALDSLRGSLASWSDRSEIELAYAQSLAFVEHIERTYGRSQLLALITGVEAGAELAEVFQERNLVSLERALSDFAQSLAH